MFLAFLKKSKETLHQIRKRGNSRDGGAGFFVVMGNEAHDLDSQTTSLALAYLLQSKMKDMLVLPVMNVPRAEAKLRKDNFLLLSHLKIDESSLVYLDDTDLVEWNTWPNFNLAISDHNELNPRQFALRDNLKVIIDHHLDTNTYPSTAQVSISDFQSCATVLGDKIFTEAPNILKDPTLRQMLRSTILMDTSSKLDSFPHDKDTYESLLSLEEDAPTVAHSDQLIHSKLTEARLDDDDLTPLDLLQKDKKFATDKNFKYLFSVSSVKYKIARLGLKEDQTKAKLMHELAELLNKRDLMTNQFLTAIFVLCKRKEKHRRLLCITRRSDNTRLGIFNNIANCLSEGRSYNGKRISGKPDEIEIFTPEFADPIYAYECFDLDPGITRKQVLPLLIESFNMIH